MRVLVNFLPLMPRGGGLQNARNLWRTIGRLGVDHEWLVVARPELGLDAADGDHLELRHLRPASLHERLWVENVKLPALATEWGADVLWTPMGAGPLRGPVPRVMGWHDSSFAYPESVVHDRLGATERTSERLRGLVARSSARGAARVTVQTPTMRRRLSRVWGVPEERFHVVPNGPSTFLVDESAAPQEPPRPFTVLVVADAKPAKNLEVVPVVARALRERGLGDVRFVLTIPADGGPWTGPLERALEEAGDGLVIERIGHVPHEELGDLYRSAAAVLLPSLFESFSATYLEAMHFGVPLVTSDMDFARELCGEAAVFADPLDAGACAKALARVLEDGALRGRLREAGFARVKTFPTWARRLELYLEALEAAVGTAVDTSPTAAAPADPAKARA